MDHLAFSRACLNSLIEGTTSGFRTREKRMSDAAPTSQLHYIERTVDVVAAYVSNNSLPSSDLPTLIASVHNALNAIGSGPAAPTGESIERPTPAQVRKSIRPDGLISFIDGKSYKTLKRHLTAHGLTPERYRAKYGLPADYPMVAPGYAAKRSQIAKSLGLGQPGRTQAGEPEAAEPAAPRTSRRKAATASVKSRASRKVEAA
jgi:predicted transcriptional regulator